MGEARKPATAAFTVRRHAENLSRPPRTGTGKIKKFVLRDRAVRQAAQPPGAGRDAAQ